MGDYPHIPHTQYMYICVIPTQVESGRRLVPTTLGMALIRGYACVDPALIQPTMRGDLERQLDQIAKGAADYEQVVRLTRELSFPSANKKSACLLTVKSYN